MLVLEYLGRDFSGVLLYVTDMSMEKDHSSKIVSRNLVAYIGAYGFAAAPFLYSIPNYSERLSSCNFSHRPWLDCAWHGGGLAEIALWGGISAAVCAVLIFKKIRPMWVFMTFIVLYTLMGTFFTWAMLHMYG